MTIFEWLVQAKARLQAVEIASASLDAELLLAYAIKRDRLWLIAHDKELLSLKEATKATQLLERRLKREPLAYIREWQEFYGRRFLVSPKTLIPRPESESIITFLKQLPHPPQHLVDIGTGSGALGITAKLELPETEVLLSDISLAALQQAKANAKALQAAVDFVCTDLLADIPNVDCIIANLPYVDKTWHRSPETNFEPPLALFAAQQGLELIQKLILQASVKLPPGGYLLLEADPRQFQHIEQFAEAHGFILYAREGFVLGFQKR